MGGSPALMKDIGAWLNPQIGVVPALYSAGATNGTGVDREQPGVAPGLALSCDLVAVSGAIAGGPSAQTLDCKLQDSADNATFADYIPPNASVVAAIPTITAANSIARKRVDLSGARRYIRAVLTAGFTGGASPSIGGAAFIELGGLQNPPTA